MNTIKIVTKAFIAWVCEGKVNLAKNGQNGRFIKLSKVQFIIDNILSLRSVLNDLSVCGAVAEITEQLGIKLFKMNGQKVTSAWLIEAILGFPSVFDKRVFFLKLF